LSVSKFSAMEPPWQCKGNHRRECRSTAVVKRHGILTTLVLDSGVFGSSLVREAECIAKVKLKKKGFKEERVANVGTHALDNSMTLESN